MPEQRRVVVTGLGTVSPVGNTAPEAWTNLLAGCSGIDILTLFDTSAYGVRIGGEVKNFKPEDHISSKELRHMDRSAKFALVAAKEAAMKGLGTGVGALLALCARKAPIASD